MRRTIRLLLLVTFIAAPGVGAQQDSNSIRIYYGGPILTMDANRPQVEALAVQDGRILMGGSLAQIEAHYGKDLDRRDLEGKTLMPGFFDAHSHAVMSAAKLAVVNTDPPPAGPADSITRIQRVLRQRLKESPPAAGQWLVGWGYDNAMLAEGRHPTRKDLDAVSTEVPIALVHFSSHQVVVNSMGLEQVAINAQSPDPAGGRIMRWPDSQEPNGILQESAMYPVIFPVMNALLSGEGALQRVEAALAEYTAQGFTTVTEMAATPELMILLGEMARQQRLPVDIIAMLLSNAYQVEVVSDLYSTDYENRLRVGGIKIILDGGSPGRSAFLREPYHRQLPGETNYRGYSQIADQVVLNDLVLENYQAGIPLYIHALGDAAVDQAIVALQQLPRQGTRALRQTQLIHVQQLQEDQLDLLADLNVSLTFQVAHNYYFGDFHSKEIYGPLRTARLNPVRSALDRGLSVSIHHDSPVHPIDQFTLIWAAVNRVTRSGAVIGPGQKITVMEALHASTIGPAYQFFEADQKGSLEAGKLADMIVLSDNPLEIDPMALRDIQVLQTIKQGRTVFSRDMVTHQRSCFFTC